MIMHIKAKIISESHRAQCSSVAFPFTGSESNRTPFGCVRMEDLQHECAAGKSAELCEAIMSTWNIIF